MPYPRSKDDLEYYNFKEITESGESQPARRVVGYHSDGTAGQLITGVDYVAGKSGIDASTESIQTISYEHHEIHSGSHYTLAGFESLDTDASAVFGVTTPDTTKWAHMTFSIEGTSQTEFYIYEAATVTGGTPATPINNNRNSSNTSGLTIVKNPTISVAGNLIYSHSAGLAGATPQAASRGGNVTREAEFILKQNTTYVFTITSKDDGNIVTYCGDWYENTNKN